MKKKILFILHLPPPVHGASMACQFIRDSMRINQQYDADYISLMTAGSLTDVGKSSLKKLLVFGRILVNVLFALTKKRYDLCYVSMNTKGGSFYKDLVVVMILKVFRKKIIYHFHNKGVASASASVVNRFFYRIAFHKVYCILLSPKLYYDIRRYVQEQHVFYCFNGIPVTTSGIGQQEKGKETPCRLLFLSNMMEEKGVYVLLDACRLLKEYYRLSFECHFIGAWSDINEDDFKKRVEEGRLVDCVFAHGKKYNEDKDSFYRNSDVFVFPTYYHNEVLPLVILEAMQFSLPVVSTHVAGIPDEVLDGKTGFLVTPEDAAALAEKISILIKDPALRQEMGKNGYGHFLQHFTLPNYENKLIEIFDQVTA